MDTNRFEQLKLKQEVQLIACLMRQPGFIELASTFIREEHLTGNNRIIFAQILKLFNEGKATVPAVRQMMKLKDLHPEYYAEHIVPSDQESIILVCKEIINAYKDVRLNSALRNALREHADGAGGLELAKLLLLEMENLISDKMAYKNEKSFIESIPDYISQLREEGNRDEKPIEFRKFFELNAMTNGIKPGNLLVLAGAYKSLKSTTALELALDLALNGTGVAVFSLELSHKEMVDKLVCQKLHIPYVRLRNPRFLDEVDYDRLKKMPEAFKDARLYLYAEEVNEEQLRNKAKDYVRNKGCSVLIIDYLGALNLSRPGRNRTEDVTYLSKFTKKLARELNCVVISVQQLNRSGLQSASSVNLAESIAPARDCDFLLISSRVIDTEDKQVRIKGQIYPPTPSTYRLALANSRHSLQGTELYLELVDGELVKTTPEILRAYAPD